MTVAQEARGGMRARWARHRSDLLLAAVVALVVVPVLQPLMAQQASRYALTAALHDGGTVVLDDYQHIIGVDFARREGRLYSDKAPGQPVLALPAYALHRALGGAPGTQAAILGDRGLWAVSLLSAALPAVGLAVLMRRFALRIAAARATEAALALSLGTMLLPFATVLFSHVASALCGLGAYLLATRRGAARADLAGAGLIAGIGVTVEYTAAVLVLIVGATVLVRQGWRAGWYALGGLLPAFLLGLYHTVAFGGPLEVSYRYSNFANHRSGLVGVRLPTPEMTGRILLDERGLFVLTPIVLVGVVGLILLLTRRGEADVPQAGLDVVVSAIAFAAFVIINGGWDNPWAGASPGPRYVTPGLPFLVGGVAAAWHRWPVVATAAAAASAIAMGLGTFTLPLAQPSPAALLQWLDRAREGQWADTLLTGWLGNWAILIPVAAAVALAVALFRGEAARRAR